MSGKDYMRYCLPGCHAKNNEIFTDREIVCINGEYKCRPISNAVKRKIVIEED